MPRGEKHTEKQIIGQLREAEVELARGKKVPDLPPLNEATSGARIPVVEPAPILDPARVLARQGG